MALTWLPWANDSNPYPKLFWEASWSKGIPHTTVGALLLVLSEPKMICLCIVKCGVGADFNMSFSVTIKRTSVYVVYVPPYRCYTEVIKIFGLILGYLSPICRTSFIIDEKLPEKCVCVSLSLYMFKMLNVKVCCNTAFHNCRMMLALSAAQSTVLGISKDNFSWGWHSPGYVGNACKIQLNF